MCSNSKRVVELILNFSSSNNLSCKNRTAFVS
nr:MAG TPA: hypothetical protein [Caudoviricetes sp.]